jgi:hypothetical protein
MRDGYDFEPVRRALEIELTRGRTVAVERHSIASAAGDSSRRAINRFAAQLATQLRATFVVESDGQHVTFRRERKIELPGERPG